MEALKRLTRARARREFYPFRQYVNPLMKRSWFTYELANALQDFYQDFVRGNPFLTRTVDRYRPPYERYVITVPRQCVFAGSVNPETYLRDETGNRRFWPVRCGSIDLDALARDRNQLWAEAVARYRDGAIWWLEEPELIALARIEQEQRYQADAWDARIDRWLVCERRRVNQGYAGYDDWRDEEVERASPMTDVSVGEILEGALGIEPARWTRADQMRVTAYLKARGWQRYQGRIGSGRHAPREWRYRS